MKQRMMDLFRQWLLHQDHAVHSTMRCVDSCFEYCHETSHPLCNYRLEKKIGDICLKLKEIQQYQKSIDSFADTEAGLLDEALTAQYTSLRQTMQELNCKTTALLADLHGKMSELKSQLHYSDAFRAQLQSILFL